MIVNDRLIYLELQKTGCTHIGRLIQQTVGGEERAPKHGVLAEKPAGRRVLGSVRNPWDYYVSLWAFGCAGRGGFHARVLTRFRRSDLRHASALIHTVSKPVGAWARAYRDVNDPECFREWLALVHDPNRRFDFGEGYGLHAVSSFAGLLTYRYCRLHLQGFLARGPRKRLRGLRELEEYAATNHLLDMTIRNENLESDLINALGLAGFDLTDEQEQAIRGAERTNTSLHRDRGYYYDSASRRLIEMRDQFVLRRYGYEF